MTKPKDPCAVCPFARDCVVEGEDKHWCLVRILTLEAWDRMSARAAVADIFQALGGENKEIL